MLYITPRALGHALRKDVHTAYRYLKDSPRQTGPKGEHFVPVIVALTYSKHKSLSRVFDNATPRDGLPLGTCPERLADNFELWLCQEPRGQAAIARLTQVRRAYSQNLADAVESSALLRHLPYLLNVLPCDDAILRFVMTGEEAALPSNLRRWTFQHAIENFPNTKQKEAA